MNLFSSLKNRTKTGILIILIIIISLPAIYQLIRPGFFPMYDDMQVIRLEQMDKCIKDGQIPCRWVPDLGYGYGYPLFQYYAPLPYYFMEAVHLFGFSYIDSVKIGFASSIVLSALFFFLLAKRFFSISTSLILTFVWVMIPFRAADIYVRGAMGEAWGMAMLPAYLWGFEKFIKEKNFFAFSLFSLMGGIFLITHNLTLLMSVPLVAVWFLLRLINEKRMFILVALSTLLSFCLASFYIIPLIAERNLVHIETLTQGYFNFVNHFSSLRQIYFSIHWGFGPSEVGSNDNAFVGIGPIHAVLGIVGFLTYQISKNKKQFLFFTALFGLAFIFSFLMHERSSFIWQTLPFMKYFQFPWRFSLVASFIFSFLSGYFFEKIPKLIRPITYTAVVGIILIIYGSFFAPKDWFNISDWEKLSGEMRERAVTASIYDYLPKSARINPADPAPNTLIIESGEVDISSSMRGTNWYKYVLDVKSEMAEIVIPAYDFPGWIVYENEQRVEHKRSGELGLLSVNLNQGSHELYARLNKTPIKIASDALSLASLGLLIGFLSVNRFKGKRI